MDRQIENPDTGERLTLVWSDGFATHTTESQYEGRMFKDYGDGRLYEYDDNGKFMETAWTWVTDNPKHTPGPWRVDGLYLTQLGVWAGTGAIVAKVEAGSHENADGTDTAMTNEEYDANAALIAAAPDMYEILREMYDFLGGGFPMSPHALLFDTEDGIFDVIGAALAKAEGR